MVLGLLDPAEEVQPILIESVSPGLEWEQLSVELHLDGDVAASLIVDDTWESDELYPCVFRYASKMTNSPRCPVLEATPKYGMSYRLIISAAGRPTASAEGVVPGDFEIVSALARGDPPGTEWLEVHWTRSEGAWRYIVGIRPDTIRGCSRTDLIRECARTWYAATQDTVLRTRVPSSALEGAIGPFFLEIFAIERGLYEHLTTGAAGDYFSVPPVQNVQGGYGAVGAWVMRSVGLE